MTQLNEFMLLFRYEPLNEEPTPTQMLEMQKHATELAKKCPILLMGGTVEARDILPMN